MREILQQRGLRFVFAANLISMLGSGMNSAAVTWFILQATHSEVALGTLVMLQTLPAVLMLPFTGVLIDREDRRRLVMLLDAGRGLVVLAVALLAFTHRVHLWHLYLMGTLVAAGFWMFWPTVTALIQELTPGSQFVHSNTFLLAGVQCGWMVAGALVGFVYNHIGLGGVLLIDFCSYVASFLCYLAVRKGRHVVQAESLAPAGSDGSAARYLREMKEGFAYLRGNRYVVLLGTAWALFIGAMLAQGVVTAPLSDRVLHAGANGYGWLNAGWAVGAATSAIYTALLVRLWGGRPAVAVSMAVLAASLTLAPHSPALVAAVAVYAIMGSARGVGGVAISTGMMEAVPPQFMGRVQNTFYFMGTLLQLMLSLLIGVVAQKLSLAAGFAIIGLVYGLASLSAAWPVATPAAIGPRTAEASGD